MKPLTISALASFALFGMLAAASAFVGVYSYISDNIIFIFIMLCIFLLRNQLCLSAWLFSFTAFSLALHSLGAFGFYAHSPLPVAWDFFSHFFPMMAVAMLAFSFFSRFMDRGVFTKRNSMLIMFALLASLGVGSLIELSEFAGFTLFGYGEGGLLFGSGDSLCSATAAEVETYSGGWLNTMVDLANNLIGAVSGIVIIAGIRHINQEIIQK